MIRVCFFFFFRRINDKSLRWVLLCRPKHYVLLLLSRLYKLTLICTISHLLPKRKRKMQHLSHLSNYLPLEVIEEILVRLSTKSLLRFRSVCKKWYSLISNSRFATTHLDRSNQCPSPYFLFGRGYDGKHV